MRNDRDDICSPKQLGAIISGNICTFLRHLAEILRPIAPVVKLEVEGSPVTVYKWPPDACTLGNEHLVIVPSGASVVPGDVLPSIFERYPRVRDLPCWFVDCFGCLESVDSQGANEEVVGVTMEVVTMTPERFWTLLFHGTVNPFPRGFESEYGQELEMNNREYVERFLLAPNARDNTGLMDASKENNSAQKYLHSWVQDLPETPRKLLLFGEAGCGKTWLLRKFALSDRARSEQNPWRAPRIVYVDLAEAKTKIFFSTGFESVLAYYLVKAGHAGRGLATTYYMEALIRSGRVVLLLDEFDTVTRQFKQEIVEYQYDHLVRNLPSGARVIVATRATRFSSRGKMIELFCQPAREKRETSSPQAVDKTGSDFAHLFGAFTISEFTEDDVSVLLRRISDNEEAATERYQTLIRDNHLTQLTAVPRYVDAIRLFLWDDQLESKAVFELTVAWLICFNLVTGRAVYELHYWEWGTLRKGILDLHKRMRILEDIAWFLHDFRRFEFDSEEMKYSLIDFAMGFFEEAINDLKCQTLFDFTDWETTSLKFRLPILRSYFIARMIYSLLLEEATRQKGLCRLGKYDLCEGHDNGAIIEFLRGFFENGYLYVPPDPDAKRKEDVSAEGYWKKHVKRILHEDVLNEAKALLASEPAFSSWTRFLVGNLNACGLDTSGLESMDEWTTARGSVGGSEGVLVHGRTNKGKRVLPFVVSETEVTNRDYSNHITDTEFVPYLKPCDAAPLMGRSGRRNVRAWHVVDFDPSKGDLHPLDWKVVHGRSSASKETQWFRHFTNDYHLFNWKDGDVLSDAYECPVVWVSFYVAAIYCNWQTLKKGLSKENLAYEIYLDADKSPVVYLRAGASGYRMPFLREWVHAARANDEHNCVWEGKGHVVERRLREMLLSPQQAPIPVTRSHANRFGIYGMIGNVREWAEQENARVYDQVKTSEPVIPSKLQRKGLIMGSTSALGAATFAYDHTYLQRGVRLPRINTNPDVGFRWVRPIVGKPRVTIERIEADKHGDSLG
jgi:formylglycine-generating enzyme required for sulfatase activity